MNKNRMSKLQKTILEKIYFYENERVDFSRKDLFGTKDDYLFRLGLQYMSYFDLSEVVAENYPNAQKTLEYNEKGTLYWCFIKNQFMVSFSRAVRNLNEKGFLICWLNATIRETGLNRIITRAKLSKESKNQQIIGFNLTEKGYLYCQTNC